MSWRGVGRRLGEPDGVVGDGYISENSQGWAFDPPATGFAAPGVWAQNAFGQHRKENEELDGLEGSRSESGRGSTAGVVQEE